MWNSEDELIELESSLLGDKAPSRIGESCSMLRGSFSARQFLPCEEMNEAADACVSEMMTSQVAMNTTAKPF